MESKRMIKVIYINSNDLENNLRNNLDLDLDVMVAIEMYSDGTIRYVAIKEGIVNYVLKGEPTLKQ